MFQSSSEVSYSTGNIILMSVGWYSKIMWEKRNGCCCALSSSSRYIASEISVVKGCKTYIPCLYTMLGPCATLGRCFVNKHFDVAMDLGKCFEISSTVRPGQVAKKPALMALIRVEGTGEYKAQW